MLTRHIVVSGGAAAGKSRVGKRLAAELGTLHVSKDLLKEALYQSRPARTSSESLDLSTAAMAVLYRLAEDSGIGLVLDSNWNMNHDLPRLAALDRSLLQIHCTVSAATAKYRLVSRVRTGERHPVHRDVIDPVLLEQMVADAANPPPPLPLDCPTLRLDTSAAVEVDAVCDWVRLHDTS